MLERSTATDAHRRERRRQLAEAAPSAPIATSVLTLHTMAANGVAHKKLRICVLQSCAEGSQDAHAELDPYKTPEMYDEGDT